MSFHLQKRRDNAFIYTNVLDHIIFLVFSAMIRGLRNITLLPSKTGLLSKKYSLDSLKVRPPPAWAIAQDAGHEIGCHASFD